LIGEAEVDAGASRTNTAEIDVVRGLNLVIVASIEKGKRKMLNDYEL
jgi:hypothetical protein